MAIASPIHPLSWSALVVEDEPRLREALVQLLRDSAQPWREIFQAGNGDEAMALCQAQRIDVAFLDIRLPGRSGLELARLLPRDVRVVFVTAYDAHAIEAFEAGAIDYLLKPILPERLQKTLERLRDRALPSPEGWLSALDGLKGLALPEPLRWITATSGRRTHIIPAEEVLFFQADSKCTRVECRGASYVITQSIKDLAAQLDAKIFQQVHRSTVVNLRAVAWLERHDGEGGTLHLKDHGALIPVSGPYLGFLKDRR